MRIVGIQRDQYGCNYYRIKLPLLKLREHGLAEVVMLGEGVGLTTDYSIKSMMESDIVVFHRPSSMEWFEFIKTAQKLGKVIVCDYDDDPFNTSPWNPYYRHIGVKEYKYRWPDTGVEEYLWKDGMFDFDIERNIQRRDLFKSCFKRADMLTTTTDILKDYFLSINKNTVTLPNLIDFSFYPKCEIVKKEIRIGWQGGVNHYEDIYMIKDQIIKILHKYNNVKFVYLGDFKFFNLFEKAPQDQVEYFGWVPHEVYPYHLKFMNLDIGLCPIIDNEFNRRKTSIKHFEYAVVGSASIASNIPPYSLDIKDGENGLLVGENGWFDAMEELIKDKQKRDKLLKNAFDDIYENHNVDKKIHLWKDAYETLLKKELKEDELVKV